VTVRADTLILQPEEQDLSATAAAEATSLRTCLDLLLAQLRCSIPIYVLITGSDHIDGFTEFTNRFPARVHQQVFGYVHPQWPATDDPIEPMVTTLNERLRQLRLSIYAQEGVPTGMHREKIWRFPEEMRALQRPLRTFLRILFPADPWHHRPPLRGLFFCSAQQDGTTFSFVRRQWQGMEHANEGTESKPYFLQDLLTTLLLRDRSLMRAHREIDF
jgi:type VI secretion system protein ImpL